MDEEVFAFGSFRLIPGERTLFEDGKPLRLGSRAFDILVAVVERAGETISKDELIARAWPDTFVEEVALRVQIAALRKALGDGRAGKRYIANLCGRGYAFIAPVTRENALSATGAPTGTAEAGNLPALLTRVVGREDVISRLTEQLVRCRFLTIVGSGGIGKTTVGVAVANRARSSYKDGAWFVPPCPIPIWCRVRSRQRWGSRLQAATPRGRSSLGCATGTRYSCSTIASTSSTRPQP